MTTAIETIRIGEDEIQGVRDAQGAPWVVLRRACDCIGVEESGQRQRLSDPARSPWATTGVVPAVAEDGKVRDLFCVSAETVPMWLATIDASRCVDPDTIRRFQREAGKAVADWAHGRRPAIAFESYESLMARALRAADERVKLLEQVNADLTPKAEAWEDLVDATGTVCLQQAGKDLGLPPNLFIKWLRHAGHIYSRGKSTLAREDHVNAGRMVHRIVVVGDQKFTQVRMTPAGVHYFGQRRPEMGRAKRLHAHPQANGALQAQLPGGQA